ncbi:hypothetical protein [Staphylococcus phage vB_SauH_DELF3]|nr:hypothetical protein [Staphylococcus phage vB_SauH_DELF3]
MRKARNVEKMYNVKNYDNTFSIEGIANELFNKESLQDLVPDFDTSSKASGESNLLLMTEPEDLTSDQRESGRNTCIDVGYVSEDTAFDHRIGQVCRRRYEKAHVMQPLMSSENTDIDLPQADMINVIKGGTSISDQKIVDKLSLMSNNLIKYLEIVDLVYFDSSMETALLKFYELKSPGYYLRHFPDLKENVEDNRISDCPPLLKCIKVIN